MVMSVTVSEAGERCHVYLLDLYISKLPPDVHKADAFYFRPVKDTNKRALVHSCNNWEEHLVWNG